MDPVTIVSTYLLFSVVGGLAGAAAMTAVISLINRGALHRGNMVEALGSLLTRSHANARLVGGLIHGMAAIGYALGYLLLLMAFDLTSWPEGMFGGFGLGLLHGIIVSLTLVWLIAEQHPVAEFREAGPAVFLSHLAGHIAYGTVVGAVLAWSPL